MVDPALPAPAAADALPEAADLVVVGAGLVGLATAHAVLARRPGLDVVVLDKEPDVAVHQSGRNSGVVHSGVYYAPGSQKALLCRRGRALLLDFAEAHGIPLERCGKVVVAVDDAERPALAEIARRGEANGVDASLIGPEALAELEPHVRGVQALHVRDAGIVDFPAVARRLAALVREAGGRVVHGAAVRGGEERAREVRVRTTAGDVRAGALAACAGLHSDRVAAAFGVEPPVRIVPFRGEYHRLRPEAAHLCRTLVYPVPDPRFPFLGVHLTRHIGGDVLAGPNAVLALRREGYHWRDVHLGDLADAARSSGLRRLARQHWRTGAGEVRRSLDRRAFARALQRMTPEVTAADLLPHRAGVRAQALHPDGRLADDFVVVDTPRTLHVLNAPSPAATASLAIGRSLGDRLADRLAR
jgi:(S)-2-hydroxyglutarate dehydrogenase